MVGAATGVLAGGAAIGLAAERYLLGRRRKPDPEIDVPLGSLRGDPAVVETDDGIELYAEVDPGPEPLTIVFVHGYALNLDVWHFQRRDLLSSARMVFYDQRSHGRSGRSPKDACNVDQLGEDLRCVLEQLVPEGPIVLVGHSMGGMTVLALAGAHPELFADRVVGVALLSTSAGDMDHVTLGIPGPLGRMVNRVVPSFVATLSKAPDLVEHGRKAGSDIGYLLTKRYSFASNVPAARIEFLTEMLAATPIEVVADFFPGFGDHDKYEALPVIEQVETVIIGGENDLIVPIEHSRELADRLPLASYDELAECGHMPILEYPRVVNDRLHELLARSTEVLAAEEERVAR